MNKSQQQVKTAKKIGFGLVAVILASLVLGGLLGGAMIAAADTTPSIGLPQFQQVWDRSDKAVAEGKSDRSWTWGPAISGLLTEPYTEGTTRQVQYFDKARMEQTSGRVVTNGLLAKEMITGLLQLGDKDFKQFDPNTMLNIAGDQGNQQNPTYTSFRKVATIYSESGENFAPDNTGKVITATLKRDGTTGTNPALTSYNVKNAVFNNVLHHNIPDVFWNFMTQDGLIYQNGQYVTGQVADWLSSFGLPLTDAYWTRTILKGQEQDVLVQAFERRVLTYTPSNEKKFQVEMGNVGQHYYDWRKGLPLQGNPTPTPTTPPTPTPTTPPSATKIPATPSWAAPAKIGPQQLWRPEMKARPTDGVAYILGETGSGTPGVPAGALMLVRSNALGSFTTNINDAPSTGFMSAHMTFGPDGTAYVVWRHLDPGYRAYLRVIPPSGDAPHGWSLGNNFAGSGVAIDMPDITYSPKTGKLYLTGQAQFSPNPAWGFAESSDGGKTWGNFVVLAANRPAGDINPRICVDPNDNVHVIGLWGGNVAVKSRYNGVWQNGLNILTNSAADNWTYRNAGSIACGSDGTAYAVWDSPQSFGVGRFTPGKGWELVNSNAQAGSGNARYVGVTVTPDGRLWVSEGYTSVEKADGLRVAVSTNRGQSFSLVQTVLPHNPDNEGALITYSAVNDRLYVLSTFKDPRESILTYTR
ncbi:MAG TPA: sialidase family protein [Chloroflexia bacterium]|nr:sialidase family protein [Chloroflexia bacterium]